MGRRLKKRDKRERQATESTLKSSKKTSTESSKAIKRREKDVDKPKKVGNSGNDKVSKVSKKAGNRGNSKVSKVLETEVKPKAEDSPHLFRGTEVVGQTDRFVLLRFPRDESHLYHVVDKLSAFVWSMAFGQEDAMNRLKYIDLKYGQIDSVFLKAHDMLVESDYHIKCTLNSRLATLDLFKETDFDKVQYHTFEPEKPKREKKIKKREKKEEKPSINKRVKRTETARRKPKEIPASKEKTDRKKKLRKRK